MSCASGCMSGWRRCRRDGNGAVKEGSDPPRDAVVNTLDAHGVQKCSILGAGAPLARPGACRSAPARPSPGRARAPRRPAPCPAPPPGPPSRSLRHAAVEDPVALVGHVGLVAHRPSLGIGQQVGDPPARVAPAEAHDLHGEAKALSQPVNLLSVLGDHHEPARGRRHDLLPQQRAAASLDETEVGVDLVRAVDREVQLELRRRAARPRCRPRGRARRWPPRPPRRGSAAVVPASGRRPPRSPTTRPCPSPGPRSSLLEQLRRRLRRRGARGGELIGARDGHGRSIARRSRRRVAA